MPAPVPADSTRRPNPRPSGLVPAGLQVVRTHCQSVSLPSILPPVLEEQSSFQRTIFHVTATADSSETWIKKKMVFLFSFFSNFFSRDYNRQQRCYGAWVQMLPEN